MSGCSVSDFFTSTESQTNQTSTDKNATINAKEEKSNSATTETEDRLDPSTVNDPANPTNPEQGTNESTETDGKSVTPSTKISESNNSEEDSENGTVIKQSEPTSETSPEEPVVPVESQPVPQPEPQSIIEDNMIMTGIIVALFVVILILVWLVYDRHKMKNKLNRLNNYPPTPNVSPQAVNAPSQNSTTIITTTLNQSPANEQLTIRVDNFQHIGARKEQQDSFCVSDIGDKKALSEKGLMAVVADGMGGLEGGALISQLVTDTFLNNYNNQFNFEPTTFLYRAAESAELAVENYMKQTGINGGSTLVAVLIKGSQMNYVSVGDSHIYLLRDDTLTLINKEHNFGALLKEKADRGEIDPREPYINPKRNSLTAYIGMGSFNVVDRNTQPIILRGGDKILLCSDGVYNALGDDALIVAMAGNVSTAARRIQSDILAQNIPSQDNFTAVIIECVAI